MILRKFFRPLTTAPSSRRTRSPATSWPSLVSRDTRRRGARDRQASSSPTCRSWRRR